MISLSHFSCICTMGKYSPSSVHSGVRHCVDKIALLLTVHFKGIDWNFWHSGGNKNMDYHMDKHNPFKHLLSTG